MAVALAVVAALAITCALLCLEDHRAPRAGYPRAPRAVEDDHRAPRAVGGDHRAPRDAENSAPEYTFDRFFPLHKED